MNLFLTGVHGYLGSELAQHWIREGHCVSGSGRLLRDTASDAVPLHRFVSFRFGESFPSAELNGIDVVVHLAYARDSNIAVNVEGTQTVYDAAFRAGVKRQVFVSSYSARPGAASVYGRLKYQLESFFVERGEIVVRPGLVAGDGGLFGRNMRKILSTPVMPLLDGGADLIPILAIGDFLRAMTVLLTARPGVYNLFNPTLVTMRTFIDTINRAGGHRGLYINIPTAWAVFALERLTSLGLSLPVDIDNMRALKQNQSPVHVSDLPAIVPEYASFDEMVKFAVSSAKLR